ncbi:MAG: hypothetical protein K6A82_00365, partial [Prevotella sp.]|nr:hypothetical protein [Prevotella sp.]
MVRRVHVLVLLLLVLSSRSLAQSTLAALQNLWGDDCLQRHAVGYVFPGGDGRQLWDFSGLEMSDSPVTTVFKKDSCGGLTVEGDGQLNTFIF